MCTDLPIIEPNADLTSVIHSISNGKLGVTLVNTLPNISIITDGDVRKAMNLHGKQVFDL
ncbi:hypothetical protein AB6F55_11780 [Providencia hangzhouensis]